VSIFAALWSATPASAQPLDGTRVLEMEGDIASALVDGVDRFLLRETEQSVERRGRHWNRDTSSHEAYEQSIEPNRRRLAHILGVRDPRVEFTALEIQSSTSQAALLGRGRGVNIFAVRWPAFGDVFGEGLLIVPTRGRFAADIVAIPDADVTPEQLVGLDDGVPAASQYARRLAESGCRVLVPMLISRYGGPESWDGRQTDLTNREFLYRPAFELGRHIIGYEVQKVLAAVDWFVRDAHLARPHIGIVGWGEGGMLALYAGALDTRIGAVCVSGYFASRQNLWQEPIDRNVFGLLDEFGDAELASMIAPRQLIVETAAAPDFEVPVETKGGPGRIVTPSLGEIGAELTRAHELTAGLEPPPRVTVVIADNEPPGGAAALQELLEPVLPDFELAPLGPPPHDLRVSSDVWARHRRQMHELDRHSQSLLADSDTLRDAYFAEMKTDTPEAFAATIEPYRETFYNDVIGRFDYDLLPPNVRTRRVYDEPAYMGYEVVMDVFPDVIAYGILLVPKDIATGERRPVVVCQHGLEGRPQDVADPAIESPHYHRYACQLAERGFVTFAPQNLYIFKDRFRTLQRKANPLGKTLFSVITPQHQQIVDWLQSLDFVDPDRVAFYGLSYGGKTAMRVPALVTDYCLSICSADFNEWVGKNASTRLPYSYVWTGEYEIFEFDLGSTFNYAEMARLISPRPFMVERGHFDGVAEDEAVAYEFAKVRHHYQAKLGLTDRCEIEWFVGPHMINGVGTFAFLHKHLDWPEPGETTPMPEVEPPADLTDSTADERPTSMVLSPRNASSLPEATTRSTGPRQPSTAPDAPEQDTGNRNIRPRRFFRRG
jgi:dienelactone hydrolase